MLEKQYSEESEDAAHRSGSTSRLFFFQVFRLRLTYQQDVMGWSYVPAYLDSLCFLEWRVSWPAQTEPKHKDMALLTTFQLNFYTLRWEHLLLWLSFEFMAKTLWKEVSCSLRKQPTFGDATTGFPAKWRLWNEYRNSILMTRHYPDLGSASDWLNQISHTARPIRSTTQIWWRVISMEFLRSFLTRHLAGKSVVAPTNVGCFLRLG